MNIVCIAFLALFHSSDTLKNEHYEMPVPLEWKIKEDCTPNDCSLIAPQDANDDTYLESINLMVAEAPNLNYPVEKYAKFSEGYLPSVIQEFEILERQALKNNGYYFVYKGIKDNSPQTWKQYYYIKEKMLYIVTFASETHKYDSYIAKIQTYLDSFKIK